MAQQVLGLKEDQINKKQFDILHKPKFCDLCSAPSVVKQ